MTMNKLKLLAKTTIAAFALIAGAAQADIVFEYGPIPANQTDNVLFNPSCAAPITGPAPLLQGCLNQNRDVLVNVQGQENLQVNQGQGGQANVVPTDGSFNYARIFLNPLQTLNAFQLLTFNIDADADGTITFNARNTEGQLYTDTLDLDENGQNFFVARAINGQAIEYVEFTSDVSLSDVSQIRIGGLTRDNEVPEPGSLALASLALLAAVNVRRRKGQA